MTWLTSLGFLGLLGLLVLILIYLLKPNFQQQSVSSTYIWKLSLKYKRRKNPISKIRNLLILICQILIITACAFILAQPAIADSTATVSNEKVVIIDASASMMVREGYDGSTRFDRAVEAASEYCADILSDGGTVTVILAGAKAEYETFRINKDSPSAFMLPTIFDDLIDIYDYKCTFGMADIKGAIELAEPITIDNPQAEVVLYTGTEYHDTGKVRVVDVRSSEEWNVAILDARAILDDGYYRFDVDLVSYGRNVEVTLKCEVDGVNPNFENDQGTTKNYAELVQLTGDAVQTISFAPHTMKGESGVYSYDNAHVFFEAKDSFLYDNNFYIYGGKVEPVKIQYSTTARNPFFSNILSAVNDAYRGKLDIQVTMLRNGEDGAKEGFDLYIYEHKIPEDIPTDGVVFLVDLDIVPKSVNITLGDYVTTSIDNMFVFEKGEKHVISEYIFSDISVSEYQRIVEFDSSRYVPIMYCEGDPVLLCENSPEAKVVIMPCDIHFMDMAITQFPSVMYGIIEYFFPLTTEKRVYDVNETITVNSRSNQILVAKPNGETETITEFPGTLPAAVSGTYSFTQTLISQKTRVDTVFVKVPSDESNILRQVDVLEAPLQQEVSEIIYIMTILFILLGVLVALLLVELWLSSRSSV